MTLSKTLFITASLCTSLSFAQDHHWLVRARVIDVIPYASSNTINIIGGQVNTISTQVVPELDVSYFFNRYLSTELILATSRHSPVAEGTILGRVNLGKVNVLPPTLTLQYHFLPEQPFNPYIGAGINYTYFYNIKNSNVATSTSYGSSVGPAVQIGVDYMMNDRWVINLDLKKVYIESKVNIHTAVGRLDSKVKINPIIAGLGVGYRFC